MRKVIDHLEITEAVPGIPIGTYEVLEIQLGAGPASLLVNVPTSVQFVPQKMLALTDGEMLERRALRERPEETNENN